MAAVIERVDGFDRLLPAAVAIARIASKHTVNFDWGPLLRAAFPAGVLPDRLSDPQRRCLTELVDNPDLWDPRHGNAYLIFKQAGLPHDRDACRALLNRQGRAHDQRHVRATSSMAALGQVLRLSSIWTIRFGQASRLS